MKKPLPLKAVLIPSITLGVLSIGLGIGTPIAYKYQNLLDVHFTTSDYVASDNEKEVCENVAKEGAVLLKNEDGALPLAKEERNIAFFGQDSVDFVYGGAGSGSIDASKAPTLKSAFEEEGFTINTKLWDFYQSGPGKSYRKTTPDETGKGKFQVNEVPASVFTDDVKASFAKDDVAVVVIGRSGGESADLPLEPLETGSRYLQVDANEKDTIKLAMAHYKKVILLVNSNNPMELGFLDTPEYAGVKAVFWIGGVGQEGIKALPKLLSGKANFSGRLPDTFAYDSTSAPSFANMGDFTITNSDVEHGNKYLVYGEGIYIGYRYYETRYEDMVLGNTDGYDYSTAVQYPFGYGLSYSTFEWSNFEVAESEDKTSYRLSVNVRNTSKVDGQDVVEFYLQKPYTRGGIEKPAIEMIDFEKVNVPAGESVEASVDVPKRKLASYDAKGAKTYVLDSGNYYFTAGHDAHDALNNVLAAKGKTVQDGMTSDGDASLAKRFLELAQADTTTYSTSSVTGAKITNALEEADVNHYEPYQYLSRADWKNTFPTPFKSHSWKASDSMLKDLSFYDVASDKEDDEKIDAFQFVSGSKDTALKVNDLIGAGLEDSRWDSLVNQLSYTQMTRLIRLGGYSTVQIDRIGLPATVDKDGPSGISGTLVGGASTMSWPAEVVMASTFNKPLIENLGALFAEGGIAAGVAGIYGPGANIHRSPYSGRNFEYFSEDAALSYQMAGHEMKGLRSRGALAYVKHFALNDQETNRYGGAVFANEQAIREVLLQGFEGAVVEGKAVCGMAAMNRVGARWVGADKGMMTTLLRDEWGFKGFMITDQASVPAMFYQDIHSGLWAGCDMWLNTNADYWSLSDVKDDKTMQYYIHRADKNILYAITNSWAVDPSYKTKGNVVIESKTKSLPWRQILWRIDGATWGFTLAVTGGLTLWYLLGRRKKDSPTEA